MAQFENHDINFEPHFIDNVKLPFIFHTDTKSPGEEFVNWHENIELLLVLEGKGKIVTTFEQCGLEPGDLCVINSNVMHYAASDDYVKYHCLIIDRSFSMSNGIDTNTLLFPTLVRDPKIAGKFLRLVAVLDEAGPYYYARVRSAMLELLLCLCMGYGAPNPVTMVEGGPSKFDVKFSIGYINANFNKKLTLDELAEESCVSKYHFTREFKRHTGDTVTEYINKVRCEHAKRLLATGDRPVEQIAYLCGFESPSYFTKVFKKILNATPSEYRRGT